VGLHPQLDRNVVACEWSLYPSFSSDKNKGRDRSVYFHA